MTLKPVTNPKFVLNTSLIAYVSLLVCVCVCTMILIGQETSLL
jgi:hypothetical protein